MKNKVIVSSTEVPKAGDMSPKCACLFALGAIWATGDWYAAINLAWEWKFKGVISYDDMIEFALALTAIAENDEEKSTIDGWISHIEKIKLQWGDYSWKVY